MHFSRNFNTLSDVLVVTSMADGHLEKLSVVTKTYFFCFLKSLIGPQKTNCIHSLGSLVRGLFQYLPWVATVLSSYRLPALLTVDRFCRQTAVHIGVPNIPSNLEHVPFFMMVEVDP